MAVGVTISWTAAGQYTVSISPRLLGCPNEEDGSAARQWDMYVSMDRALVRVTSSRWATEPWLHPIARRRGCATGNIPWLPTDYESERTVRHG